MGDLSKYQIYRKYITSDGVNYTPLDEYQAVVTDLVSRDCSLDYDYVVTYGKNNIEIRFLDKNGNFTYSNRSITQYDTSVYVCADMLDDDDIGIIFATKPTNVVHINWDKILTMQSMFTNCNNPIDTTYFDTKNVTNMSYAFSSCSGLTSLDVGHFNTSNVTTMSYMFSSCSGLTSLDVSKWDTSNVTNMSYMFKDCRSLTSLDVSKWDMSNVTNLTQMFYNCKNLTHLDLSGWALLNPSTAIGNMTYGCSNLDTVIFCKKTIDGLKSLSNWGLGSAKTIDFSKWDTSEMTTFASLCSDLNTTNFIWGDTFNTSNITNMSNMFYKCSGLTSLDLSGWDTSKVTDMSQMFYGCSGLTSLDVSNFDTSKVTNMNNMFYYCRNLTSLDLSSFDTSNVTNMNSLFYYCGSLTSLDLSNFDTSNVTDMGHMFYGCTNLTSLDLSNFDTSNVTNMSYMFENCANLTSLDLSGWDMSNVTNRSGMFSYCNNLKTIYVCGCNQATIDKLNRQKPSTAELIISPKVFNDKYVCGSEIDGGSVGYQYEVWEEVDCMDNSIYTGNVEYRNPQPSCDCGLVKPTWVFNDEYVCGSEIGGTEDVVTYISNYSNGSVIKGAYIETGIKASTNLRMQIDYVLRDRSGGSLIGSGGNNYRYFNYDGNSGMYFDIASGGASGTQRIYKANSSTIGTRYNIEVGNYYIKNLNTNTYIVTGTPQNYSYEDTIKLFGLNSIDGSQGGADGADVYSFKIYDNEVLVRDFIPYKENGIFGMYDLVEGKFYGSVGSGQFIGAVEESPIKADYKYEVWRETNECNLEEFTGNVEYRNGVPSDDCVNNE